MKQLLILACSFLLMTLQAQAFFNCSASPTPFPWSCGQNCGAHAEQGDPQALQRFSPVSGGPVRAVVVTVHGLNTKPEIMDPLIARLVDRSAEVIRVGLTGHRGDSEAMKSVTEAQWKVDLLLGYSLGRKRADELKVPLYFVGYSLGALVHAGLMGGLNPPQYDRQVLLAPAIHLKSIFYLIKFFEILGDGFCIPSLNDSEHRANQGTSVAAYKALFRLLAEVRQGGLKGMDIPTWVAVDSKDELVDLEGIQADVKTAVLRDWTFESIDHRDVERVAYRHSITDEAALGPQTWSSLVDKIQRHLRL